VKEPVPNQEEEKQEEKIDIEEAKQKIVKREKEKEMKKKNDIELLKLRAKEREHHRIKRHESSVLIQKTVRGFL